MNEAASDHEARIANLESTIAFQDRLLGELNQALVRQQSQIDRIEERLQLALSRPQELVRDAADEEPPPHY